MLKIKKHDLWKNLLLLLVVFILMFVCLEVVFRFLGVGEVPKEDYIWMKHNDYSPFLVFGPNINKEWVADDNKIVYWNSQGFRMKEDLPVEKGVKEYRVFAIGASTTANWGEKSVHYCNHVWVKL